MDRRSHSGTRPEKLNSAVPSRIQEGTVGAKKDLSEIARWHLEHPYNWAGRETKKNPGLDAIGLLFIAINNKYGINWKRWSVKPSELIKQFGGAIGGPVFLPEESSKVVQLDPGDLIFFLWPMKMRDKPVAKDSHGRNLYAWHEAIYSGNGNIIHASPFRDKGGNETYRVLEEPMLDFIRRTGFAGYVPVRYEGRPW